MYVMEMNFSLTNAIKDIQMYPSNSIIKIPIYIC